MAATGTLQAKPLAQLLAYVLDARLSGSLELTAPNGDRGIIVFRGGSIARIKTSQPVAYLGTVLYELGIIDADELNASLVDMAKARLLHGQVLLGRGAITPQQLAQGIREQTARKVGWMFGFDPGSEFSFAEGSESIAGYGGINVVLVDPCPLLWRAIVEAADPAVVGAMLGRVGTAKLRLGPNARIERFGFSHEEMTAIDALDTQARSLAEFTRLGALQPERARLLLYCLLITKQLELVQAEAVEAAPVSGMGAKVSAAPSRPTIERPDKPSGPPNGPSVPAPAPSQGRAQDQTLRPRAGPMSAPPSDRSMSSAPPSQRRSQDPMVRARLAKTRASTIPKEDYFARLGVPRDASSADIDRAYMGLSRVWDPSALPPDLGETRADYEVIRNALAEAYRTLCDPKEREQYVLRLLLGNKADVADDLAASGADDELSGARACLAKNDIERAERLARRAHKAKPQAAVPLALLAWIEAQKPANQSVEATRARILMIDRAVTEEPECAEALFYRAMLHKRIDNHGPAMRDLNRVVSIDPLFVDAERELRLYEVRVRQGTVKLQGKGGASATTPPHTSWLDRVLKK